MINFRRFIFMMLLFALSACGGADETATTDTAVADVPTTVPTEAPPAEPTEQPAEDPTVAPTDVPPEEPTEVPTEVPTEEPTVVPAPAPAAERIGVLRFRDNGDTQAGKVILLANAFPPAPAGSHYELWLVDSAQAVLNLGEFTPEDGAVQFEANREEHLLGLYEGAFISVEPDSNTSGEIGLISASGAVPAGSMLHIRHVVYKFGGNPEGHGFLNGARSEMLILADHGKLLMDEIDAVNLPEAQRHAEHVINIINGEGSDAFGDLDGDGVAQNPGDGLGLINYMLGAKLHADLAANADDASFEVQLHNGHVQASADNALLWLGEASAAAVQVLSADSAAEASGAAKALAILINSVENGEDVDGDGNIAPVEGEGGLLTAWEHALNMGSVELLPSDGLLLDAPAQVVDADSAEVEPASEEDAVVDSAADAGAVSAETGTTVDMLDFSFDQATLTVQPGTVVTWNNAGNARHSATADDGSFDTGLYAGGESRSITFDAPGTYTYYCELHGGPGLQGMAATIVVAGEPEAQVVDEPEPTAIVATEVPQPTTVATLPPATATAVPAEVAATAVPATAVPAAVAATAVPAQPTATPLPPQPTATPEAVVSFAGVNMEDFEFVSNRLTVKKGTVVTWSNIGSAPHSARSDTGLFDTGLYGGGEARSITFDTPGTYSYFCELHGQAGGGGMAGVIIVED